MSKENAEQRAKLWYDDHKGKIVLVDAVEAYVVGKHDDGPHTICLNPPAKVRIEETPEQDTTFRWMDEWLDPAYEVSLAEPHPLLTGKDGFWVYGHSIHQETGQVRQGDIVEPLDAYSRHDAGLPPL